MTLADVDGVGSIETCVTYGLSTLVRKQADGTTAWSVNTGNHI